MRLGSPQCVATAESRNGVMNVHDTVRLAAESQRRKTASPGRITAGASRSPRPGIHAPPERAADAARSPIERKHREWLSGALRLVNIGARLPQPAETAYSPSRSPCQYSVMGPDLHRFPQWRDKCAEATQAQRAVTEAAIHACTHGSEGPSPEDRAHAAALQAECAALFRALIKRIKEQVDSLRTHLGQHSPQ